MARVTTQLFNDISNFQIGPENDSLTFTDRLCRENGWTKDYAKRCVAEYKKFIYLAMISEQAVTPSDEVDQVWHLHLTYTQSYWIDLCRNVLGKSLHHGPTKGGASESRKYRFQYQATLDKYREVFGLVPQSDIWPDCEQRFDQADKFVRLNTRDYVVLKKRSLLSASLIVTLPAFLAACVKNGAETNVVYAFLSIFVIYILYVAVVFFVRKKKKRNSRYGGCGGCGQNNGGGSDGGSGCGAGCGGCGG